MNQHIHQVVVEAPEKHQPGVWSRIGGEALTFAIVFHVVLLLIAAIWMFTIPVPVSSLYPKFIPLGDTGGGKRGAQSPSLQKPRALITPSHNVRRVVAEGALSEFAPLDPGIDFAELSVLTSLPGGGGPAGMGGSGLGSGFGPGKGSGIGNRWGSSDVTKPSFGPILPPSLGKRCAVEDRRQRILQNGGTPACEDAVVKGLRWLKANQQADGSWGDSNKPAMTGFALLAYFGHCETTDSVEFGTSVARGLVYLIDLGMKNQGKLGTDFNSQPFCYEHAIATYALAEAATLCKQSTWPHLSTLTAVTQQAGQFIIDNQHKNGGWAYQYATYDGHTDVSVVGWQVQALKACSHVTNVKFNGIPGCISQALKYVNSCQDSSGGYGYTGPGAGNAGGYQPLTGVGMLCNQMWDKGKNPEVHKAAEYVLKNSKFDYNTTFADLYGHYYESQAMIQRGGAEWKKYNDMFRDQLLNNQDADGSWKVPGGGNAIRGGPSTYVSNITYRTTLCTLMLEVYYRFLSTGGDSNKGRAGFPGI